VAQVVDDLRDYRDPDEPFTEADRERVRALSPHDEGSPQRAERDVRHSRGKDEARHSQDSQAHLNLGLLFDELAIGFDDELVCDHRRWKFWANDEVGAFQRCCKLKPAGDLALVCGGAAIPQVGCNRPAIHI
jgi:hypothetical protein